MANFLTPSQIQLQYFQILKSLKPSLNINDVNSDFVIRGNVFAAFASGLYGDQAKVDGDIFISSARPEALTLKGLDLALPQLQATQAESDDVQITGTNGTPITPGQLTFLYLPTNILYTNTTGGIISGGILNLSVQAESVGSIGNITAPDTLQVVSPPSGVGATATLIDNMADGTDLESTDSYRARLLARVQNPPAGGNLADYIAWGFQANAAVRSVQVFRFGRGLGTVDIYITTGPSNIDAAVTQGLPIVRIPSGTLISEVQAFYNSVVPLTDCAEVFAPTELDVNVTMDVDLAAGYTMSTVPADPVNNPLNLTCMQLIQREMGRPLYEYPVGGRAIPGETGTFVIASDIAESVGVWLSAEPSPTTGMPIGIIPILADFQVQPLDPPHYNLPIAANQLPAPGTMTVVTPVP